MIVPKKPLLMRKSKYLRILTDTFRDQIPMYLRTGPISFLIAILMIGFTHYVYSAYPDRNELQKVIDAYSVKISVIDEIYKENNPERAEVGSAE